MKTSIIYCLFLFFSVPMLYAQQGVAECDIPFNQLKEQKDAYFVTLRQQIGDAAMNEEGSEYTQYQKWLKYWEPRIAPNGTTRDYNNRIAPPKKGAAAISKALGNTDAWMELGPYNKPNYGLSSIGGGDLGIGVIRGIVIHKTNSNKLMCWSSASGLFYSSNKAQNWSNVGSDLWPRSGCKWAEFAPDNETTWYACSAPGGSYYDSDNAIGKNCALYRTTNSGVTWSVIADYIDLDPVTPANGETAVLQKILIDPNAANVGYLATSLGLYVSTNINNVTPSAVTWTKVLTGSICDMEFRTNGSSNLYVSYQNGATWNIAYTTNLGSSWTSVPNQPAYTSVNHVSLAVSDNAPNNLYVIQRIPGNPYSSSATDATLYSYNVSTFGVPTLLSSFNNHVGAGYGFAVSNFNANIMYVARSTRFYKSIDGGLSWTVLPAGTSSPTRYHDDVEYFITPRAACLACSTEVYVTTHGGVNYSSDQVATLTTRSNGLGVAKVGAASNSALNPEKIIMGLDHDGSVLSNGVYSGSWIPSWETVYGGDGMQPLIDYSNSNYVWASYQTSKPYVSSTGGVASSYSPTGFTSSNDFGTTYAQNKTYPNILYCKAATNVSSLLYEDLFRSDNRGYSSSLIEQISDFKTVPSPVISNQYFIWGINPSPSNPNYCYVSLGNNVTWDGRLYRSTNILDPIATNVKNGWVELDDYSASVKAIDNNNPNIVYLSKGGDIWSSLELIRADYTNPTSPVFINIAGVAGSGGLPNIRVLHVVLEKGSNGGIYVGTDAGIYYANNSTISLTTPSSCYWTKLGVNLPNIPIAGLEINYKINKLRVSTVGRGIWEHDLFCSANTSLNFTAAQNTTAYYEAINQITSTSTVGSTSKITYRGGTYVDLNTGFISTTNSSNYFEAFIHPCSYPGNSPGLKILENGAQEESTDENQSWGIGNASEISVYPNPNNGKFNVSINVDEEYTVDVYSLMGQKVLSLPKAKVREKEIDLTGNQKGIYLIEFKSDKDFKSIKVVYE